MEWFLQHVLAVSIVVVAGLFVAYYLFCARKIRNINRQIEHVLESDNLAAALSESTLLAPAWKLFEKSLTRTPDKIFSTIDAAEFFSERTLTRGMNMTFWQAYGGIFTGLGILGTFAGLTFGLGRIEMTSDIETLKGGIANLLTGVESAFVTSLVGIGAAIVYSIVHHYLIVKLQKNIRTLTDKLDENFPRRSVEDWLAENFTETKIQTTALQNIVEKSTTENLWLEKNHAEAQTQTTSLQNINTNIDSQKAILQNIGEDVAQAIYDGLDERINNAIETLCTKLEERLLPQTNKICAAIENLSAGAAKGLADTMSKVAGAQMDKFSDALDRFSDSIDKKLADSQKISDAMNNQLMTTLETLRTTLKQSADTDVEQRKNSAANFETLVTKLVSDLKDFAEAQKKILSDNANSNAAQISEAVKTFREIVDAHNRTTQKTFDNIQKLLDESETYLQYMEDAGTSLKRVAEPVRQSSEQLSRNLSETSEQMKTLSTANQTTRQNLSDLAARLDTFVKNFNGIANELERSTKIISNSLDNYNGKMSEGLTKNLSEFEKNITQAFSSLNEIVDHLEDAVNDFKKIRR